MASTLPLPFSIDKTLGAGLVGFSVACVGFGVHTLQTFSYFQRYPLDRPVYKALVAFLWVLELIHQIFIAHVVYFYTISNFTSPLVILVQDVAWTLIAQILLGTVVGTTVKACYAMRVWRFSNRNMVVSGALALLILGQMGANEPCLKKNCELRVDSRFPCHLGVSFAFTVRCFVLRRWTFLEDLKLLASLSLGLSAFTDIVTALALALYLRRLRTGYKRSDTLITHLTVYAINTGAVTSACSIVVVVLYDMYTSQNFYFLAMYYVLIKLYAISFMCTLNTRRVTRGRGTDREGTTSQAANLYTGNFYMVHHRPSQRSHPSQVHSPHTKSQLAIGVHQEVSVISDVDEESANLEQSGAAHEQRRGSQSLGVAF
ncbi:hypothetical protein CPB85DRAFT_186981 [Mucidula mucida]|nr:hypothetical protein CPB85DRAFT_186981 [Mucidula mucida]